METTERFNRFIYWLCGDSKIAIIEDILQCEVIRNEYQTNGWLYTVKDTLKIDKCHDLECVLKRKVSVIKSNYRYYVKVYRYSLPTYCEYQTIKSKNLILGVGYDGIVSLPINDETNNYLIVGASGSGKSSLAISILQNLILNHIDVIICDNKSSYDYEGLTSRLYKGLDQTMSQINQFESLINNRLKENKEHDPILIVIDELFPFLTLDTKPRKQILNQIALIMSKCRSVNAHMMLITQRATSDIIDTKILTNISNRICLATSSVQESINVLNTGIAFDINTVGRGYLSVNGRISEFQSFYTPKEKRLIKNLKTGLNQEEDITWLD